MTFPAFELLGPQACVLAPGHPCHLALQPLPALVASDVERAAVEPGPHGAAGPGLMSAAGGAALRDQALHIREGRGESFTGVGKPDATNARGIDQAAARRQHNEFPAYRRVPAAAIVTDRPGAQDV